MLETLLLVSVLTAPIETTALQTLEEHKIELVEPIETPKELTLEEKIATNINGCNEEIEWIRKDTAECKPKEVITQVSRENPSKTIVRGSGSYYNLPGQCTTLVASMRYVPSGWGNALSWKANAQRAGWYVGSKPVPSAIGWRGNHVVIVLEVRATTVLIKEANYDWNGSIRTIERPLDYYTYLY